MQKLYVTGPQGITPLGTATDVSAWLQDGSDFEPACNCTSACELQAFLDAQFGPNYNTVHYVQNFAELRLFVKRCVQEGETLETVRKFLYIV